MNKTRILVADDDPDLLKIMTRLLSSEDTVVFCASDGKTALERAAEQVPDMVILDVEMPGMNGFEVCIAMRRDYRTRHIPVLMLTGKGSADNELYGINMGADDYMTKPFESSRLKAKAASLLCRVQSRMELNPLTRLPGNRSIRREAESRLLSGGAFAVTYLDIRRFKLINDRYGFQFGDRVILALAELLREFAAQAPGRGDFIGHVGGDDFVLLTERSFQAEFLGRKFDARLEELFAEAGLGKPPAETGLTAGQLWSDEVASGGFDALARTVSARKEAAKKA